MQKRTVKLLGAPSRRYISYHWRCTMSASEFNAPTSALTILVDMVDTEFVWIGNKLRLAYAVHDPEPYTQIHDIANRKCLACYSILENRRRRLQCQRICRAGQKGVAIEAFGVALREVTVSWCSTEDSSQMGQHNASCRSKKLGRRDD